LDLLPTLLEWLGSHVEGDPSRFDGTSILPLVGAARPPWRDALVAASDAGHRAIRTADWCLRQDAAAGEPGELYVRPDDRWEFNDVAKLCPEETESLARAMDDFFRGMTQDNEINDSR
jgi:arylsulfatase A-like enzyme